jgi:hypothetical protein
MSDNSTPSRILATYVSGIEPPPSRKRRFCTASDSSSPDSESAPNPSASLPGHGLAESRTFPRRSNHTRSPEIPDLRTNAARPTLSGGSKRLPGEGTLDEVQTQSCAQADDLPLASYSSSNMLPTTVMGQTDISKMSSIFKDTKEPLPATPMNNEAMDVIIAFTCDTRYQEKLTPFGELALDIKPPEELKAFFTNVEGSGPPSSYTSSYRDSHGYSPMRLCSSPNRSLLHTPTSPGMDTREHLNSGQGGREDWDNEM